MTVWGPNFNGRVFAEPDRSSAEPENQAEALKPCPFCGGNDIQRDHNLRNGFEDVFCDECGAIVSAEEYENATAAWNRRASLPEAPAVPVGEDDFSIARDSVWRSLETVRQATLQSSPPVKAAAVDGPDVRQIIFDALDLSEELRIECTADVVNALTAAGVLASQHDVEGEAVAWIVGNGDGTMWRMWTIEGPIWTWDRDRATRYARRVDAESVHAEDEGAWTVVPYSEPSAHDWFTYKNMECCQKCGNVRNETSDSRPCKGRVSVGLRDPRPTAADAGVREALREAFEAARYKPGDHPVVPVKIAAFMKEVERILSLAAKREQAE